MEKEKQDKIRGETYHSGVVLIYLVPSQVSKMENESKERKTMTFKLFCCYKKTHKTIRSKKCKYITCKTKEDSYIPVLTKGWRHCIQRKTVSSYWNSAIYILLCQRNNGYSYFWSISMLTYVLKSSDWDLKTFNSTVFLVWCAN